MKHPSPRRTAALAHADKEVSAPAADALPPALAGFDSYPDSAYVRLPVVCALFQVSPSTIWRWSKSKRIAAPRRLSDGVTAWNVGELRKSLNVGA